MCFLVSHSLVTTEADGVGYHRLSVDLYEHAPVVKNPLFKSTKQRLRYILLIWDLSAEVRITVRKRQQKHPYLRSLTYPSGCLSFVRRSLNSFTLTAEITPVSATMRPFILSWCLCATVDRTAG